MDTELLVVGGGPAGYTAAIRAAQRGLDVTLVEADAPGGTCLNYGCIPSKALLHVTGLAHETNESASMGIRGDVSVDVDEMVSWKDGVVRQLTGGVEQLLAANGVELVEGYATYVDDHTARVDDDREISFEQTVVATGSRPMSIPGFDFRDEPILDARQALALEEAPSRLVVIGAGYIGMELATVFARLGTDVTVIEMLDDVLAQFDPALATPVRESATDLGIDLTFEEAATGWATGEDAVRVETESPDGTVHEYPADAVLVAVGREPVTDELGLDALGVALTDQGFVQTDGRQRTSRDHVFAIGDVAGEPMLAHKGSHEGAVAAAVAAGGTPSHRDAVVPSVVYTHPEVATVGYSPSGARSAGLDPTVGRFPIRANGRALSMGESNGFVRVVAASDGTIVGAQVVGPEASELINQLTVAIHCELTLSQVGSAIHAHPTLSEAVKEAAENGLGEAIHTTNR